jgi:hypothetical protein
MHIIFTKIEERDLNGLKELLFANELNLGQLLQERNDDGQIPQERAAGFLNASQSKLRSLERLLKKGTCTKDRFVEGEANVRASTRILNLLNQVAAMPKSQVTTCRATTYSHVDAVTRIKNMQALEEKKLAEDTANKLTSIVDDMMRTTF